MTKRLYLTQQEVISLLDATSGKRHHVRDKSMILLGFLHGLRVSELTGLTLEDVDIHAGRLCIRRLKNGLSTIHPLQPVARELLAQWLPIRNTYSRKENNWLFLSAMGNRLSRQRFYTLIRNYARISGIPDYTHPHMLRHACGYELAEQGMDTRLIQDYLGHRNIRHTLHYTAANAARFSRVWNNSPLLLRNTG
ncbi:tyrosine-type recombinase/integrase [Citrobacter koseri]|uniref:tyrosine-type recombinase/integrase n=1 Tax=Citrobacter koseri TaxID=545 RepID=UPI001F2EA548|nr:tyrosine-type recombinase/integrase [Citrobacter koseri]